MNNEQLAFDQRQLRDVLGSFVTGVTVVSTRGTDGALYGVTANSFSSVSLDPPLVLWSQSLNSSNFPAFNDSDHFVINILAHDQVELSNHFAKSQPDKFVHVDFTTGIGDCPVLTSTAASIECTKVASYPGGDHVVYIGQVQRINNSGRRPLAFGAGKYMSAYAHDLGPVSLQIGSSEPTDLAAVAQVVEMMPDLAEALGGHTLCLSVWGNHGPTAIHWQASSNPVSDQLRLGLTMPITQSATGLAFAAFMDSEKTRPFILEELRTLRAPGDSEAVQLSKLEDTLDSIRQDGYARISREAPSPMHQIPVRAISVPLRDANGHMTMALSLTTPSKRLSEKQAEAVAQKLVEAARQLS